MGKVDEQHLQEEQNGRTPPTRSSSSSSLLCKSCSPLFRQQFTFKCLLFLVLGLAVTLSAVFWVLPRRSEVPAYEAKESVRDSAAVQAFFKLPVPARSVVPNVERLEYDMYGEIGFPNTLVSVLSARRANEFEWTDVVFGVLPDRTTSIDPVSLSVLRSSFIDLFLEQFNMTLTVVIFGKPSSFEIVKFPGGITISPDPYGFWQSPQVLFNFTLNNSIRDVENNYSVLKRQLKYGLRLRSYENVYVQVTNKEGSTMEAPVTAEASVTSETGNLLPNRLRQLAQIITGSPPATNLGLDDALFGKVKEVILSSFLNRAIEDVPAEASCPSPSPAGASSPSPSPAEASSPSPAEASSPSPSSSLGGGHHHGSSKPNHASPVPTSSSSSPGGTPTYPPPATSSSFSSSMAGSVIANWLFLLLLLVDSG